MKNKIAKQTAQQGDCLCRKLGSFPEGERKIICKRRCVLIEGEHSGHAHVVEDDEAELIQIGERMLLKLGRTSTIQHQEHGPVTLSPGIWEIGRVQEFDHLAQMAWRVMD